MQGRVSTVKVFYDFGSVTEFYIGHTWQALRMDPQKYLKPDSLLRWISLLTGPEENDKIHNFSTILHFGSETTPRARNITFKKNDS